MEAKDIIKPENLVYQKSRLMSDATFNFCPGCGHCVVVRTIAEVIVHFEAHPPKGEFVMVVEGANGKDSKDEVEDNE